MDRWLQQWEDRRLLEPSLTPEEFLAGLGTNAPPELLDDIRRGIDDLDRVEGVLRRMKALDRRRGGPGHGASGG